MRRRRIDLLKNFRRKTLSENILNIIVSLIFFAVAASYVYIFVWAVMAGAKEHSEIIMKPFASPEKWHWEHYLEVFDKLEVNGNTFWDMLFNSIYFSVICVFVQQLTTIAFAYCCTKYTFPGSKLVYPIVLVMITLPLYGNSGAMYTLLYDLGLIDSYAQIITSLSGFSIHFLYYMAFYKNLSNTYWEAAILDGANDFQVYYKVMLPQAKPIFGALFLTNWLTIWNSYESALVYLPNLPTLPVGIYQFSLEMRSQVRLDILFAACVIICIPAFVLFLIFNKTITSNISVGGIKG